MYHMGFMNKWIDLYDKKREEVLKERRQFKRSNLRNTPLPSDLLGEWGKDCTLEWVTEQIPNQIEDACIDSNITEDEINMCRGCERKVLLEFYKMLFPYSFDTINFSIFLIIFVFTKINGLSQARKYPTMWAYGRHYHVESVDVKR
jgi:predicted Fe-S protein YdhL (DUF1289 family)